MRPAYRFSRRLVIGTAAALVAGTLLLINLTSGQTSVADQTPMPHSPAGHTKDHAPETAAPWAGSSSCRECHATFYEKWATSRHGLAMQPFTPEFAAAELKPQGEPIMVRGVTYQVQLSPRGGWVEEQRAGEEKKYGIEHALGGKYVYYFLTPMDRGRLQVLPLAYDVRRQEWFDTTGSAARGIMHFEDEVLDWRAPQLTFNTSCHGCHVSQFSANFDPQTDSYHATWAEPGINCETCHASGVEHVRLFRALGPNDETPVDPKIISTKHFSIDQINDLCAPCHAKSAPLTNSFTPGNRFFDNYDLVGPEHSDFYPDGRDLGENYTYTSWRMSPCVKSGALDCMHCHTSSGRYRFADDANQACLPCHRSHVADVVAHTHHQSDSAGSKCVACHMPVTEFARMLRSDHSMRPPMPAATLAFRSPNACNQCHADQDAAWADKHVREWRSRDYQAPVLHVGGLVRAAREGQWARLPDMLAYLSSTDRDEIFATALIRLLRSCEDPAKWPVLVRCLEDPSPLVRSAAAVALDHIPTKDSLEALLEATRDDYRLVRVRAAASLAGVPVDSLNEGQRADLRRATDEFLAIAQARPDDAASHHNLGNFYMDQRNFDRAVESFERAFRFMPDNAAPLVNASIAHNVAGRNDKAEESLRRALRAEPKNAAASLNLGLLLAEMGQLDEAQDALRAAFENDPQSDAAAYNLGVMRAGEHPAEGVKWCRTAYTLRPTEPKYAYTLAFYLLGQDDREEAIALLRTVTDARVPYLDAYILLGRLLEEGGAIDQAVALYRDASAVKELPEAAREQFRLRAERMSTSRR